jgi:formylglycine-generating enzyme required for sulfatase activity
MVAVLSTPPRLLTNSVGMRLALIPAGTFLMGSPAEEVYHSADEGPRHPVAIKRPFYLGVYPVMQREFEAVMRYNPSRFPPGRGGGPEHPVSGISWEEAVAFCAGLSGLPAEGRAGSRYRLPTEAEWEYACRAGSTTAFAFGDALSSRQANFDGGRPYGDAAPGPFLRRTTRVGSYPANAWGLCDMQGNVWEWCDGYYYDEDHERTCPRRPEDDRNPRGGPADPRVVRGGCWASPGRRCRAADRYCCTPAVGTANIGLRVLVEPLAARGAARREPGTSTRAP